MRCRESQGNLIHSGVGQPVAQAHCREEPQGWWWTEGKESGGTCSTRVGSLCLPH